MSIAVLRRTFAASKHPPGSEERTRLNRDTLTSEFYASHRYMTREPFTMSDGTPHPSQHHLCRTFKTKGEADKYATGGLLTSYTRQDLEAAEPAEELAPAVTPARRVKIDQADLFADQGALFGHVKQPGELE